MFHDFSLASMSSDMFSENSNPELDAKVKRVTEKLSENIHIVANEPSLALYRIQEHVRKSIPQLVQERRRMDDIRTVVQGACYDAEYGIDALKTMSESSQSFKNIQDLMKNSMFLKQQITYENTRRSKDRTSSPSLYRQQRQKTLDLGQPGHPETDDVFTTSASVDHFPRLNAKPKIDRRMRSSSVETPRAIKK